MTGKIEKLLKAGKVNVQGHMYALNITGETVELIPVGSGDIASAEMSGDAYAYTHGGDVFRKAVEAAWEIDEYLIEQRKKNADY